MTEKANNAIAVSEMPAGQMELFPAPLALEQPDVDQLCALIRFTALREYGKPVWREDPYASWIARNFSQADYGLNGIDKRLWGLAYSTVGVEVGNLPAMVLGWYRGEKNGD